MTPTRACRVRRDSCVDAPVGAGVFGRLEHVIGCFHVSGLKMRRCSWPLAGMAMRGAEAHQTLELRGPLNHPALSAPDLDDRLPLQIVDLLTPPRVRYGLRSSFDRRRVIKVLFVVIMAHRPRAILLARAMAKQHAGLLGQHSAEPAAVRRSLAACMLHDCHRSCDEHSTYVALAHLRCRSQPRLAACRVLSRDETEQCGKVAGPSADGHGRREGLDRHRRDGPDPWHRV